MKCGRNTKKHSASNMVGLKLNFGFDVVPFEFLPL